MSMGSDTAHDADTLQIHHDLREQHIHFAGLKAMYLAAREFDADAAKSGPALCTPACPSGQDCVGSAAHSVGQRKQCRCGPDGCADGQCPGRVDHIGEATRMVQHLPTEDTEGGLE